MAEDVYLSEGRLLGRIKRGSLTLTLDGDALGIPELAAADPTELDFDTPSDSGLTTATLLETIARRSSIHRSGQYYFNIYGTSTAQTLTQDLLCLFPVVLSAGTMDRIGVHVSTAQVAGVIRLGVYADDGGLPLNRIAEASSTADASTTGTKDLTISAAIPKNGLYWLAVVAQAAAGIAIRGGPASGSMANPLGTSAPADDDTWRGCRTQSGVTGALPASLTIGGANSTRARVFFRYA